MFGAVIGAHAMGISASALVVSGAAALVYQSVWARMLHRVFGVGDQAIATVLGVFFLGMALGSFAGGRLSRHVRSPGRAYAALEIFIGAWALLTLSLLPRVHSLYAALVEGLGFGGLSVVRLGLATLILLPPTVAMGATLPVLMRARWPAGESWPTVATRLYLSNTFGAIVGAGATGFALLPRLGGSASLCLAAGMSALAAALVSMARLRPDAPAPETPRELRSPPLYLGLAASTGAASLAGEVLWTRVLRILVQGTTQAFAAMLVAFLSGLVLGGILAGRALRTVKPASALFATQLFAGAFVAASIAAVPQLTRLIPLVVGERRLVPHEPWSLLLVSFTLLLPLATCLGASLPILFRMAGAGDAGSRTGGLLGANTLGGLVGSLAAGFVLVPLAPHGGLRNTLLGVAVLHVVISLTVIWRGSELRRSVRLVGAAAGLSLLALISFAKPDLELAFLLDAWHDVPATVLDGPAAYREEPVYLREGRNTTVSVLRRGEMLRLFNDGRPESGMDFEFPGFGREIALLGALPAALAERTERAMVIGLGGGHVVTTLLAAEFERVTVVELEEAVVEAARTMHDERNREAARETPFPLDDPRVRLIVDDARARLKLASEGSLDAIVSQPSHPWLAGSSALYTREFFEEVRASMHPGGVFSLWVNLFRMDRDALEAVVSTLRHVFPHVVALRPDESSFVLAASGSPLVFGSRLERRIARRDALETLLRPFGLDAVEGLLAHLELDEAGATRVAERGRPLTDDLPRLEFELAGLPPDQSLDAREIDAWLAKIPWLAHGSATLDDASLLQPVFERRVARVRNRPVALARVEGSLEPLDMTDAHELRGLIAERRGDVEGALSHYERAASGSALTRADELLRHVGERRELLERALSRAARPDDSSAALLTAMALGERDSLALLLARRDPRDLTPRPLLRFADAYAREGCAALPASVGALAPLGAPEPFRLLYACLVERGDLREAERALLAWTGRRDRDAREAFAAALEADAQGNHDAAILDLRATVTLLPGHPGAATRWLELLVARGRTDEARRELPGLLSEAELRGDGSLAEIEGVTARLGL